MTFHGLENYGSKAKGDFQPILKGVHYESVRLAIADLWVLVLEFGVLVFMFGGLAFAEGRSIHCVYYSDLWIQKRGRGL